MRKRERKAIEQALEQALLEIAAREREIAALRRIFVLKREREIQAKNDRWGQAKAYNFDDETARLKREREA